MEIVSAEEAGRTKKRTKKKSTSKLNVDRAGIEREEALFRALDTAREGFVRREVIIDALSLAVCGSMTQGWKRLSGVLMISTHRTRSA